MCGVYFYPKELKVSENHFKNLLIHRGPDYQNKIEINNFVIGHNLLSIRGGIEISSQPYKIDNNYLLSFNGEIYNTNAIINEFNLKKSLSDTNILAQLITKKGKDFINYIDGMYAIILFDIFKKEVSIYRDHSGQKNIYYYNSNKGIVLSSEILPITKLNEFNKEIDYEYLNESFILGYPSSNKTIFKNIKKLKPGEKITFNKDGNIISLDVTKKEIQNQFSKKSIYDCIDETVKNHTLSDHKVGINLSAGLDSNIILYHSIKHKSNIESFSTFFENVEEKYNLDFYGAEKISNYYGIKFNKTIITKKDYEDVFSKSFSNIEEINRNIGNPSYLLNYSHQNEKKFKTILSGDGGDELFVGYDWYFKGRLREKLIKKFCFMGKKLNSRFFLFNYFSQFDRYNFFLNKFLKNKTSINPKIDYSVILDNSHQFINQNFSNKIYQFDFFKLFLDQYLWLPNEVLLRADKLGMFNSLEIRNPFCDQNLRKKMFNELSKNDFNTKQNKHKIREIYSKKIPQTSINNRKYGWTSPKDWIESKKIKSEVLDNLPPQNSELFRWIDLKNEISKNKNIMSDRSIYPLISLVFLIKKFNLSI